ncbi:MAG: hypothetical protein M3N53_11740 [Actinomycetota bacterium]|nr:hypothetical protein [Actinomycetota bacterium]
MRAPRNAWNTATGLILIGLVTASPGCARSSDTKPPAAASSEPASEPEETSTSTPEERRVLAYPAQRLPAGVNRTAGQESATLVEFQVPAGWWGEQGGPTGWALSWGPDPENARVSLWVDELDMTFEKAVAGFRRVKNLEVPDPTPMQIDGHRSLLFAAEVTKGEHALLDEALGVAIDVIGWVETRQAFVDLGRNAMIVRIELPKGEKHLPEALKVLRSFRFDPAR